MKANLSFLLGLLFLSKQDQANAIINYDDDSNLESVVKSRDLTVFIPDGRREYEPYRLQRGVGLLSSFKDSKVKNCTATLIDRELILTAAECITTDNLDVDNNIENRQISEEFKRTMRFHFGYSDGKPSLYNAVFKDRAFVPRNFLDVKGNWEASNFAIIQIYPAIGDVTEFMSVTQRNAQSYLKEGVNLVSFMFDMRNITASADYCCQIVGNIKGLVKHQCDTVYGSAGAPLYEQFQGQRAGEFKYRIIAMNTKQGLDYNFAVASKPIFNLLNFAKAAIVRSPKYIGPQFPDVEDSAIACNTTLSPTRQPVRIPTRYPVKQPATPPRTNKPTLRTNAPAVDPTQAPKTNAPVVDPTRAPKTNAPVVDPTRAPKTNAPAVDPTRAPKTHAPAVDPTRAPKTHAPAVDPTRAPKTHAPAMDPTRAPKTHAPAHEIPTRFPTERPAAEIPTRFPTERPAAEIPTRFPTERPAAEIPTRFPTERPVAEIPTRFPTERPVAEIPTKFPTERPAAEIPTRFPTERPAAEIPTRFPTERPADKVPTCYPTDDRKHKRRLQLAVV